MCYCCQPVNHLRDAAHRAELILEVRERIPVLCMGQPRQVIQSVVLRSCDDAVCGLRDVSLFVAS